MRLKYKKMILFATMGIMGIGMLSFSFETPSKASSAVPAINASSDPLTTKDNQIAANLTITPGPTTAPTLSPTPTPVPEDPLKLKKDAYPELNELISTYYQAMVNCDEETLKSIVTDASVIDIGAISRRVEYIKNYHNITCYTKPGVADGDYFVYAVYDMEIVSIETYAPCLDVYYVTTIDGKQYLKLNQLSDEMTKLKLAYNSSEDVIELGKQTDQALLDACASDESLNDFFQNLMNRTNGSNSSDSENAEDDSSVVEEDTSSKNSN